MADDEQSFELEEGELVASVVHAPSAADVQLRAQLDEAATALRSHGQAGLARLALGGLVEANLHDAISVVDDDVRGGGDFDPALFDEFCHKIRARLRSLQESGYDEHVVSEALPTVVLEAAQHAARLLQHRDGMARSLEKQTFRAAAAGGGDIVTECTICFEEFVDGGQVSVMPCPSRVHRFHPDCISKWLKISNVCPLCRHELPAYYE